MGTTLKTNLLQANKSYAQDWQDRLKSDPVIAVCGIVFSDKSGTLYVDESDDGGETSSELAITIVNANTTTEQPWVKVTKRWYRFRYVNGVDVQGSFVLLQDIDKAGELKSGIQSGPGFVSKVVPVDTDGDEKFTVGNPAVVEVQSMGHVDTVPVTDPDAETANQLGILRGILKQFQGGGAGAAPVQMDGVATEAKQDVLNAKDFATQTTLAAILAKIIPSPATEAKLEAVRVLLAGTITETPSIATVGVATIQVLAANANRKYASFQNDSDTDIYLMINSNAVINQGIRLNPNGGSYEMSIAAGNLDTRVVNAICSVAGKNLLVREGV